MSDDDIYYEGGAAEALVGKPRKRRPQQGGLSAHVPVRFAAEMIERVRRLADEDGLTVSSWIRKLVERELERRQPRPETRLVPIGTWTLTQRPAATTINENPLPNKVLEPMG